MASAIERLQDYTLAHQRITLTLAAAVVSALAFDAITGSADFGPVATWFFRGALLFFAASGLSGGVFSAKIVQLSDQAGWYEERMPLFHFVGRPQLSLKGGTWRTAQHRFLWAGILSAAIAGMTVAEVVALCSEGGVVERAGHAN